MDIFWKFLSFLQEKLQITYKSFLLWMRLLSILEDTNKNIYMGYWPLPRLTETHFQVQLAARLAYLSFDPVDPSSGWQPTTCVK